MLPDLLEKLVLLLLERFALSINGALEYQDSPLEELALPGGDLVGMQVELLTPCPCRVSHDRHAVGKR